MASKTVRFSLGALGSAAALGVFFWRHWELVTDLSTTHDVKGVAVGGATFAIVALLGGCIPLLTGSEKVWNAFLLGTVLPLILFAARVPTPGLPPVARPWEGTAVPKRPTEGVWLVAAPGNALGRQAQKAVFAEVAAREAAATEQVRTEATRDREAALQQARDEAAAAQTAAVAAAVAARDAKLAALQADATKEREAALAAARAEADRRQADAIEGVRAEAQGEKARLQEQLDAANAGGAERDRLAQELAAAKAETAEARAQSAPLAQAVADHKRFAEWLETDLAGVKTPGITVLGKRLASRDPTERAMAARLLPMCGAAARPLLERAKGDADTTVRDAVVAALARLGQ